MSDKRTFIDSNILLYLFTNEQVKKDIVSTFLLPQYVISTQVVNENMSVCLKKLRLTKEQAFAHGKNLMDIFTVVNISSSTVKEAFTLSIKYNLSYWDSLIVSAALENKCQILLSEDMQHGFTIEGQLKVVNPFL